MARKRGGSGSMGMALVLGLLLPAAALVACFSMLPRAFLYGGAVPGVSTEELAFYGRWLDLREPVVQTTVDADTMRIGAVSVGDSCLSNRHGPEWTTQWIAAPGLADTVLVRRVRTMTDAFVVKFRRDAPWNGMRQIVVFPAGPRSLHRNHLYVMCEALGLPTPRAGYLRMEFCGGPSGVYAWEERFNDDLLERYGITEVALATMGFDATRPDHLMPMVEDDSLAAPILGGMAWAFQQAMATGADAMLQEWVDVERTADVLLMMWLADDREAFTTGIEVIYGLTTGRLSPAWYMPPRNGAMPGSGLVAWDPFTSLMGDPAVASRFEERRRMLLEQADAMEEAFISMESTWLPLLSEGTSSAQAAGLSEAFRKGLMQRLREGDAKAWWDRDARAPSGSAGFAGRDAAVHAQRWLAGAAEAATILGGKVVGDSIVLSRGKYRISADVVMPKGMTLVMEKGVRMEIAPQVSILVQGPLHIRGTRINPVFIRPLDPSAPFGTVAVSAPGSRSIIQGLQMSGGREAFIAGYHHSGMLSLHGTDVEMTDCVIGPSFGEDGLNVKDGAVSIRDCRFLKGRSDLVDLDRATGEVIGCSFMPGGTDTNGDGLDLSRSRVVVKDSYFDGIMDKGISVGEGSSVLVYSGRFIRNSIAIAVKDGSIAHVAASEFQKNALVFGVYRKKPMLEGGILHLYTNTLSANAQDLEVDARSVVEEHEALPEVVWRAFGAEPPEERRPVRRAR